MKGLLINKNIFLFLVIVLLKGIFCYPQTKEANWYFIHGDGDTPCGFSLGENFHQNAIDANELSAAEREKITHLEITSSLKGTDLRIFLKDYGLKNVTHLCIRFCDSLPVNIHKLKGIKKLELIAAMETYNVRNQSTPEYSRFVADLGKSKTIEEVRLINNYSFFYHTYEQLFWNKNLKTTYYLVWPNFAPISPVYNKSTKLLYLEYISHIPTPIYRLYITNGFSAQHDSSYYYYTMVPYVDEIGYFKKTQKTKLPKSGNVLVKYPSGRKAVTGELRKSKPHGNWTFWDDSSRVIEQREYNEGLEVGTWYQFQPNTGDTMIKATFVNGEIIRATQRVYRDKVLLSEGCVNCSRDSLNFYFFETYRKPSKGDDPIKYGDIEYYDTYWVNELSTFEKVTELVINTHHSASGDLLAKIIMGVRRTFYSNGHLKSQTSYKNNVKDGEEIFWNEDGTVKLRRVYSEGKLIE